MSEPHEIAEILLVAAAAYPNFKLPPESVKAYTVFLEHLSADVLRLAVMEAVKESVFFPTVAEIMKHTDALLHPSYPTAGGAWGEAVEMMRFRGHSWEPKFDNPITQKCIEALGWYYLCMSINQVADRARFIELYDELARRTLHEDRVHPLVKQLVAKMQPAFLKSSYYEQLPRGERAQDLDEIEAAYDRGEGE